MQGWLLTAPSLLTFSLFTGELFIESDLLVKETWGFLADRNIRKRQQV
jgi:hypothetical protein